MSDLALAIEGATYSSSVALLREGRVVADAQVSESAEKRIGRGEALVPLIHEIVSANGVHLSEVNTIICGAGPGSFTSLRVAASVAKGIAFASGAKMYAVPSLLLIFGGAERPLQDGNYVAALPAMRGEFFALPVTLTDGFPAAAAPTHSIVSDAGLRELAREMRARVIGPGREIDAHPHARGCAAGTVAGGGAASKTEDSAADFYHSIIQSGPIDLSSWEPDYGRLAEAQVKWEAAHGRPLRA
jgi:tRNA threonylcarbamoyladenosine biosynthesis protein TsaB